MSARLFFTLLPPYALACVALGLATGPLVPDNPVIPNALVYFGLYVLALKLAVIIHEAGHLVFARLAGGKPIRMVLGMGVHELYRRHVRGVDIIIHKNFRGGYAQASFTTGSHLKLRYACYMAGGALGNLVVAAVFLALGGPPRWPHETSFYVDLSSIIITSNVLLAVGSLVPFMTNVQGRRVPTDGLYLLKLPFIARKDVKFNADADALYDIHRRIEAREYTEALPLLQAYLEKHPTEHIQQLTRALLLLKTGQFDASLSLTLQLREHLHEKAFKPFTGLFYNLLAWTYLVHDNIEQADIHSALAIQAVPGDINFRSTRGAVLIEKGKIGEGVPSLLQSMDFEYVNNATLSAAIHLLLACHRKGDLITRDKYHAFLEANYTRLDVDEKHLLDRILSRTGLTLRAATHTV
ncbi:site-2 protease family protein [Dawidia soli]|uniref:Peptidase M50 domain-containing protein n=1 Tax=Dawidia soli TaxID=2782352 RepID=A0AAP2DI84_9BACT|nr:site-2 protease family protein [Dawidia soli]MBT1689847.1 hypothetical protein [Dawidia soli]